MDTTHTQIEAFKNNSTTVITANIKHLFTRKGIDFIVSEFYNKTQRKLDISYCGSKGYLSHIEFWCEGEQLNGLATRIDLGLFNRFKEADKKIVFCIQFHEQYGINVFHQFDFIKSFMIPEEITSLFEAIKWYEQNRKECSNE